MLDKYSLDARDTVAIIKYDSAHAILMLFTDYYSL